MPFFRSDTTMHRKSIFSFVLPLKTLKKSVLRTSIFAKNLKVTPNQPIPQIMFHKDGSPRDLYIMTLQMHRVPIFIATIVSFARKLFL